MTSKTFCFGIARIGLGLTEAGNVPAGMKTIADFIFAVMELTVLSAQFATNAWMVVGILSFTLAVHQAWSTNIFTLSAA